MSHINRRHFLGATAAASAAAVGGFGRLAEAAGVSLTPGVPEGVASYATMGTLPGKKPLIQLIRPAAELRNADRISPHADHAERPVLRPLSPGGHPGGRRRRLQDRGRRRRRQRPCRDHARRSEEDAGRRSGRGQPVLRQPARPVEAACAGVEWGYGAMGCARWKGARLKDVLDKAGLKKEAIEIVFNGADGPVGRQDAGLRQEHSGLEGDR